MPTHFGITHTGLTRLHNEDRFGIFPIGDTAHLYVVCDGIGGAAGGERAAETALSSFSDYLRRKLGDLGKEQWSSLSLAQVKRRMRSAATYASQNVYALAQQDPSLQGMGSTLVAALVTSDRIYVLHVGDSRLYAVSAQGVEKMTRDHSYIQYLIDVGRVSPAQANDLGIDNYITQAIGAYPHVDGDFCAMDLSSCPTPTYLLLCSDGLYSCVRDDTVQEILLGADSLADKAHALLRAACEGGGHDNITAVIVAPNA